MTLQTRLEPKVAEIERLANESYGTYLEWLGLMADERGVVVDNPEAPVAFVPSDVDPEVEQTRYDGHLSLVSSVTREFEQYYDLDPFEYTTLLSSLGGREGRSGPVFGQTSVFDRINHADDQWIRPVLGMIDAEEWTSDTATRFYDRFLMPFHKAASQQMDCTKILGMAAQAFRDATDKIQDDVLAIADATITCLNGEGGRSGESAGFFTAVSFIAGAVGLFLPTGASQVAGGVSLASGVASMFAGTDDSDDSDEWKIDGLNGTMILESTWDRLMELRGIIQRKDGEMAQALLHDRESPNAFSSPQLRLTEAGLDPSDSFGQHKVGTVLPGVPISQDEVVVTVVHLHDAGNRYLPSAAYQYDQARLNLVGNIPAQADRYFPRSRTQFQIARSYLRGAVSSIRDELERSGEALVQIASDYETTDEQAAEALRQIGELDPPVLADPLPNYY